MARLLLEHEADKATEDEHRPTALSPAVKGGHKAVVQLLEYRDWYRAI